MEPLTQSSSEQEVQQQYRLLKSKEIPVSVTKKGELFILWVLHPAYLPLAKNILLDYQQQPEKYQQAIQTSESMIKPLWTMLAQQAGLFTFLVTILTLATALFQYLVFDETVQALLITPPYAEGLQASQPWRLFTPAFLHFSATHLIFNLYWWWYLGGKLEIHYGSPRLIALFFITGVLANLTQFYWQGPLFGGLSGVVYGLFGFFVVMSFGKKQHPLQLPKALVVFMLLWMGFGFLNIGLPMANEAHLAGFLSGSVLGAINRFVFKVQPIR